MRKKIFYTFFSMFFTFSLFGQHTRFEGFGNTSIALYDIWSSMHNQAGLANINTLTLALGYSNKFLLSTTSTQALSAVLPTKTGNFALSFQRFGYSLYSENNVGLAYARSLGKYIDVGIQFDYLYYLQPENYGKKGFFLIETGFIAKPIKNLFVGIHVYNPIRTKLANYNNERVPTRMRFGLAYYFSDQVMLSIETEKSIEEKARFKAGIEYQAVKKLYIRTGFNTHPIQFSFGTGYTLKRITADVAIITHQSLPLSTSISIKYAF